MNHSPAHPIETFLYLTAREAAEYLRVSLSTLHRMEQRGLLTPLRTPGGHRRYTHDMLNDCLSASAGRPLEEVFAS